MANEKQQTIEDKAVQTLAEQIIRAMNSMDISCDRTYLSVIIHVNPSDNTYVIKDSFGDERTVKCAIPNIKLKTGQNVWVKEPSGNRNRMHICGIN